MSNTAHKEKLMQVLLGPHVSEKSARVAEGGNQFVFKVRTDASKPDIKAAVELMFEVQVESGADESLLPGLEAVARQWS